MTNGECYCPNCGHDGAMDGQGNFFRDFRRYSSSDGNQQISQSWHQMRCTDCGQKFRVLVEVTSVDIDD